jgi:hypothetical protein
VVRYIKWYHRLLLLFRQSHIKFDDGGTGYYIKYKRLFGSTFIIGEGVTGTYKGFSFTVLKDSAQQPKGKTK